MQKNEVNLKRIVLFKIQKNSAHLDTLSGSMGSQRYSGDAVASVRIVHARRYRFFKLLP